MAAVRKTEEAQREFLLPGLEDAVTVIPTRRGREALYLILKALELSFGARIGVPLYTCSVVAKTVVAAGLTPVFLDADSETFGLSLEDVIRKAEHLDGLLLVHSFGYPADFNRIAESMAGKPVIEDCAHALGSRYKGSPLGLLSALSFFSFGFFKPEGIGGGGCIVTRDPALTSRLRTLIEPDLKEDLKTEVLHVIRNFLYACAWRRTPYTCLTLVRDLVFGKDGSHEDDSAPDLQLKPFSIRSADSSVLRSRLTSGKFGKEENSDFWSRVRETIPESWHIPPEPLFGSWNHFLLPIDTGSPTAFAEAVRRLRGKGIGVAGIYRDRRQSLRGVGYTGDCPQAERLSNQVMVLPSHSGLSEADRERILNCLRNLRNGSVARRGRMRGLKFIPE